jgi:hypothetical protein
MSPDALNTQIVHLEPAELVGNIPDALFFAGLGLLDAFCVPVRRARDEFSVERV